MNTGAPSMIERWVNPGIREQQAYHVPEPKDLIKLDAMENPYPWPPELRVAWQAALAEAALNRYPDAASRGVVSALRQAMAIPDELGVILGNGSDELIQMLALTIAGPGRVVMAPEPGFVMYRILAKTLGLDFQAVPLNADFSLDEKGMLAAIETHNPALLFIAYPNNPTGNLFDKAAVQRIIEASPGLVIIDEAYHVFAGDSFLSLVTRYPNVLLLRTLSKMGLAGLRLGFLVGSPAWLEEINKTRLPYNIGVLNQVTAEFALQHADVFYRQSEKICADRERLLAELQNMPGVEAFTSHANFILFRVISGTAEAVFEALKQAGILIKCLHGSSPALADCLRVTVGTESENSAFVRALQKALGTGQ